MLIISRSTPAGDREPPEAPEAHRNRLTARWRKRLVLGLGMLGGLLMAGVLLPLPFMSY